MLTKIAASLSLALAALAVPVALAAPVVDGVKSAGEWDAPEYQIIRDSFINGGDATGGYVRSTRRVTTDANFVYVSYEGDTVDQAGVPTYAQTSNSSVEQTSTPTGPAGDLRWSTRAGDFVNAYLFTASTQTAKDGTAGFYGDLDDVLVEGTNQWGFANNAGFVAGTVQPLVAQGGNVYADVDDGIFVGYGLGTGSNFYEVAIARGLVDYNDYSTLRVGGQTWAYGNTFSTFDAVTAIPEPMVAATAGALLGGTLLRRRRAV